MRRERKALYLRNAYLLGFLAAVASFAGLPAAKAVDLFGTTLFGDSSAVPPGALPYSVALHVEDTDNASLKDLISGISHLMTEQVHGASDAYILAARARGDVSQIQAALYSEGYYAGEIDIRIAGQKLDAFDPSTAPSGSESGIEVAVRVTPGPRFVFGDIVVTERSQSDSTPPVALEALGFERGKPAKSGLIVAAREKLIEAWRSTGFPLARIVGEDISADHASSTVNVRIDLDPGPPAVYGWVNVSGAQSLDHHTILEQSKLRPGSSFRTSDLKQARDRIAKLPSVESVQVVEGQQLDANGGIPVSLEVVERKPRYFGATASLSTIDGAEVEAHWGHRNFFGEGEHLRVEGTISRIGSEDISQLEFDAAAIYTKPGILDVDTDLVSEFRLTREHPDAYESLDASYKIGLAHVFTPSLSGSAALSTRFSRTEDAFGQNDYMLISLPAEIDYDTRDQRLDATKGHFIFTSLTPSVDAIGGSAYVKSEIQAAAYRTLDSEGRAVLAGRIGVGSIAGASLADVPASTRFFAGGGGSVRGYGYRSLGPMVDGTVVGGLGYIGGSAEMRLRVTELFGIVPFVDAATVSEQPWPNFSSDFYVSAGVGLRYYTALGPIRLDVATPVTHRDDQPAVAIYIGLGQAF
ncbi:MAG: autotransporter assembly complex family protein [Hyphomicrobiaceae bacterium]